MILLVSYAQAQAMHRLIFRGDCVFVVAADSLVEKDLASLDFEETQVVVRSGTELIGRVTKRCIVYDKDDQMVAQLIAYTDLTIECFRLEQPLEEQLPALVVQGKNGMDPSLLIGLLAASLLLSEGNPSH